MHSCIIYSHWLIEFSILAPKITEFFSLNLQSIESGKKKAAALDDFLDEL